MRMCFCKTLQIASVSTGRGDTEHRRTSICPDFSVPAVSSRNHKLSPRPNRSNSPKEHHHARHDAEVAGELFGREDLLAHEARERRLVRVREVLPVRGAAVVCRACAGGCCTTSHYFERMCWRLRRKPGFRGPTNRNIFGSAVEWRLRHFS